MDDAQFEDLMERLRTMSSILETISLTLMEIRHQQEQMLDQG